MRCSCAGDDIMSTPAANTNAAAADSGELPVPSGPDEMWEEPPTGTMPSPQVMTTPLGTRPAAETPASTLAVAHAAADVPAGSTSAAEVVASPVAASASAAGAGVVGAAGQLFVGAQKRACSVAFEVGLLDQQLTAFHMPSIIACLVSLVVMSCTRHDGSRSSLRMDEQCAHINTAHVCADYLATCQEGEAD